MLINKYNLQQTFSLECFLVKEEFYSQLSNNIKQCFFPLSASLHIPFQILPDYEEGAEQVN